MTAATIELLSSLIPTKAVISPAEEAGAAKNGDQSRQDIACRFVQQYTNLAFGWYIAGEFARNKKAFPTLMLGKDKWVYRAYLYRLSPSRNFDNVIREAKALSDGDLESISRNMRALLIVKDNTTQDVADALGINHDVVEAYEVLFFNVIDRRADSAYIAQAVYPETRFVTLRRGYFDSANVSDLLIRAGYESGDRDAVAYMAGLTDGKYMRGLAARGETAQQLEGSIMANAVNIATIGLVNETLNGMKQSRALMVADKQGGVPPTPQPILHVASMIKDSLNLADGVHNTNRRNILQGKDTVIDI